MKYFTPATSAIHGNNIKTVLRTILAKKNGIDVRNYVKSIQPSYREKKARGPSGNPEWDSTQRDSEIRNRDIFLLEATIAKFKSNEEFKKALLATGDAIIHDDENYDNNINFGSILMGARSKLRE
jgi:predicted NAD-dependent protein-ADP-ribosyltransferase YbiA (DUF1768 family)